MATNCNDEQCIVSCSCNSDKGWYYHTTVDQPVGQSMTLDPSTLNESANITYSTRATTADDYYITATSKRAYADLGNKHLSCRKAVDCEDYGYVSSCSTGTVGIQVTVQTDGAALTCYKDCKDQYFTVTFKKTFNDNCAHGELAPGAGCSGLNNINIDGVVYNPSGYEYTTTVKSGAHVTWTETKDLTGSCNGGTLQTPDIDEIITSDRTFIANYDCEECNGPDECGEGFYKDSNGDCQPCTYTETPKITCPAGYDTATTSCSTGTLKTADGTKTTTYAKNQNVSTCPEKSDTTETVTNACGKCVQAVCPDGYYEDVPPSPYFKITATSSTTPACYKASCDFAAGYSDIERKAFVLKPYGEYHGLKCGEPHCAEGYTQVASSSDCPSGVDYNGKFYCCPNDDSCSGFNYFHLTMDDTRGISGSTFKTSDNLYSQFQNHKGNTPGASYYARGSAFVPYNKISSTSETCTKTNGIVAYKTICSGVGKGNGCGKGLKWVSNGCSSTGYTVGPLTVEGAEFGECVCDPTKGYYESNSDCTDDGYSSCKASGICYVPTCKARGYFDTLEECKDAGNEACKLDETYTSTGSCYRPAYFNITYNADIFCSGNASTPYNARTHSSLTLIPEGKRNDATAPVHVYHGHTVSLPEGKYSVLVSTGNTSYPLTYECFSVYLNSRGVLVGSYTSEGSVGDNGMRTTEGVHQCASGYDCYEKELTFSAFQTYLVEPTIKCSN